MNASKMMIEVMALLAVILLFKPLLVGMAKAAWLAVHPRLTKEERTARRTMRDAQLLSKLINRSTGPSEAAELRALMARA